MFSLILIIYNIEPAVKNPLIFTPVLSIFLKKFTFRLLRTKQKNRYLLYPHFKLFFIAVNCPFRVSAQEYSFI